MGAHRLTWRRRRLVLGAGSVAGAVLLAQLVLAPGAGAATFGATASVDVRTQYVGDVGKDFTFTVTNTGTVDPIAAVLISRPNTRWAITACPAGPAGWTAVAARTFVDTKCRYTSAAGPADDITPGGSSAAFVVRADSVPGAADASGNWVVWASKSGSWGSTDITAAAPASAGTLGTTAHVWEITDAVVTGAAVTPDSACPPAAKQAGTGADTVIVICGRSHANTALTPVAADSTLGGTFLQAPGTFTSGPIAGGSPSPVVLGNWSGATVTGSAGAGRTVVATIGSGATATSPSTTLDGYTATAPSGTPVLANIETTALGYTENGAAVPVSPAITVADADSATLAGAIVQITANYQNGEDVLALPSPPAGITPSFDAGTGVLSLTGSSSLADYQTALRAVTYANTSDNPSTAPRTVSFQVDDGVSHSNIASRDIAVTAANDAPVLADIETGGLGVTEGSAAMAITSTLTVADADSANLASATVVVSTGYQNGQDVLALPSPPAGITPSFDAASGTLTLTGSASVASYETALRGVTYENTSDSPSSVARTVTFQVNDGAVDSNVQTRDINVTGGNVAPVLGAIEGTAATYTESGSATALTSTLTVTDGDSPNLAGATVSITGNFTAGQDVLALTSPPAGITPTYNAATGVLTLTGSASPAAYQTALRAVTYANTSDAPSTATRTVVFQADDGAAADNLSNTVSRDVTVAAANDAPSVTLSGSTPTFTEDGAAVVVDGGLTIADADDTDLVSGSVTISAGLQAGDVLAFTAAGGITDTNAAPDVLALTGTTSVANWQSVLQSVTFSTTNQNPTPSRTVSFTVNDGDVNSATANKSIAVTAVNDAPVVNASGGSLAYQENAAATPVDGALGVTDADSANLVGATVRITGGYVNGEDVLSLGTNPQSGITASFNAGTGTLTLTGSSSVANYQAALRDVRYANTSQDPSTAARTVSFQVDDGPGPNDLSNVATRAINVTRVNDAPVGVADAFDALGNTRLLVGLTGTGPRIETAGSVTSNDTDVDTPQANLTALPQTKSSTNCSGCNNVTIDENGSFTYDPPAGFTGNDTFTYTVRDNDTGDAPSPAATGTGTVTITVQGPVVWYVDSTPAAGQTGNTGRSHSPFTSTTGLQPTNGSVDDVNEIIFVYGGTYTAANGLALQTGQKLLGEPHGLTVDPAGSLPSQTLVPANAGGTNPELRATGTNAAAITLANDVEIQRVNASNSSAGCTTCTGIRGTSVTTASIGANTQISGNSGPGLLLSGTAGGNITVGAQITGNSGVAVSVAGRTGGTVGFTGQVNSTGAGVSLTNNNGATITFSGSVILSGANARFVATGGGTVNAGHADNVIGDTTPATGPALNVANTTIGGSGLKFRKIASTGGANGIILDNTGTTAGLTVTGTGGSCTIAAPTCTGGRIQSTTGADGSTAGVGIYLNNTRAPSLSLMRLNDHGTHAIRGNNVAGFTMNNVLIDGANGNTNSPDEGSINFTELTGSASITNSVVQGGSEDNVKVRNTGGSLNRLTFDNVTIGANSTGVGNDGISLESTAGTFNVTVNNSRFTSAAGDLFQLNTVGTAQSDLVFTNNTLTNNHTNISGGGGGTTIAVGGSGDMTYNISNNTFRDSKGTALVVSKAFGGSPGNGTMSGRIEGNTIGVSGVANSGSSEGSGINVIQLAQGSHTTLIRNNTIYRYNNFGILVDAGGSASSVTGLTHDGAMNATIQGNIIAQPNAPSGGLSQNGIHLNSGTNSGDQYAVCMAIGDPSDASKRNTVTGSGALGGEDYRLRSRFDTTVRLPGYTGTAHGSTDGPLTTYLTPRTSGSFTLSSATDGPPGFLNTAGGAACPLPA